MRISVIGFAATCVIVSAGGHAWAWPSLSGGFQKATNSIKSAGGAVSNATKHATGVVKNSGAAKNISKPHVSMPHVSPPHLSTPHISTPHISAPKFSAPHISAPHISAPKISAPHISAPKISAPHISAPHISAPTISMPHVSAPKITAPHISMGGINNAIPHINGAKAITLAKNGIARPSQVLSSVDLRPSHLAAATDSGTMTKESGSDDGGNNNSGGGGGDLSSWASDRGGAASGWWKKITGANKHKDDDDKGTQIARNDRPKGTTPRPSSPSQTATSYVGKKAPYGPKCADFVSGTLKQDGYQPGYHDSKNYSKNDPDGDVFGKRLPPSTDPKVGNVFALPPKSEFRDVDGTRHNVGTDGHVGFISAVNGDDVTLTHQLADGSVVNTVVDKHQIYNATYFEPVHN